MKALITRHTEPLRFERAALGGPAKVGRSAVLVALCTLALLAAAPANAQGQGSLVSWGTNNFGVVSDTPVGIYTAIAGGSLHSAAIRTDGTLVSWGNNSEGEVSGTPTGTYTAVAAGGHHSVAIRTDSTLVSWGWDYNGATSNTPATGTYSAVAAGNVHNVAIRTNGTLVSWGDNYSGQVSSTPTTGTYTGVAAGYLHSVAIRTDGTLVSWGNNFAGQVSNTPAGTYTAVTAGDYHSMALRTDGTLVSWGYDNHGQVSGTPVGTYTAIAAGALHSVALRTDGTHAAWGAQLNGTPAGIYFIIAAGGSHNLAIGPPRPVAIAGPDQSIDCASPDGATVTLNGSASYDAHGGVALNYEWSVAENSGVALANADQAITSGEFSVGVHEVTLMVYDIDEYGVRKGGVDVASVTITVVDDDPPVALVTTDIASLWPANGGAICPVRGNVGDFVVEGEMFEWSQKFGVCERGVLM